MMLKCAVCGEMKKSEEFPVVETTKISEKEVLIRRLTICLKCLERIKEEDDRELIEDGFPF